MAGAVRAEPPGSAGGSKSLKAAPGSVELSFLPPPVRDALYSVGIYEAKTGKLVRRLHEMATDEAFSDGLNGLMTHWNRKDDAGRTVPAGKYTARGWAVGEKLQVEGVEILGNDWIDDDGELRVANIEGICLVPTDDGLALLVRVADGSLEVLRVGGDDGKVRWHAKPPGQDKAASEFSLRVQGGQIVSTIQTQESAFALEDGQQLPPVARQPEGADDKVGSFNRIDQSSGRAGTWWTFIRSGLIQLPADRPREGELPPADSGADPDGALLKAAVRHLPIEGDGPAFLAVSASKNRDRLYLLEKTDGWQRVRGLEWVETKPAENGGQPVSEWKTFFERSIRRPDPALGLEDPATITAKAPPSPALEVSLGRNPLEPGKRQSARLRGGFDEKGAYLETGDGLRLLQISELPHLRAVRLVRAKAGGAGASALTFYQTDGAAWDEFALTGVSGALMSFDAGEFELTATGEKRPEGVPTEPKDL